MDTSGIPVFDVTTFQPDGFQSRALKTWRKEGPNSEQLIHAVMGLAGESGELLDKVKKGLFKPGYELTPESFRDEVGDALYYLAVLTSLMGLTLEQLSALNRAKLEGGGHGWKENEAADMVTFSPEEAEHRIKEAVKNKELGASQFNAVVMGILKGLESGIRNEIKLEFSENIYKDGFEMAVWAEGNFLFSVFFPRHRVLAIQRG